MGLEIPSAITENHMEEKNGHEIGHWYNRV